MSQPLAVIIHGGAGSPETIDLSYPELPFLKQTLDAAWQALVSGESGERVVVTALRHLEDCEYCDAGYGSFPNENGEVFMDVGLMRGNGDCISLMNLSGFRYPSEIAYDLWEEGRALQKVSTERFVRSLTEKSPDILKRYGYTSNPKELVSPYAANAAARARNKKLSKGGTVGCVVRDESGSIFAGTSTGGTPNKIDGRVGDSPIVGSGFFADNEICGLSATGHGESFLRSRVSSEVISAVKRATREDREVFSRDPNKLTHIINAELKEMTRRYPEGEGGLIVIPVSGNPSYGFNSKMMYVGRRVGSKDRITLDEVQVAHE